MTREELVTWLMQQGVDVVASAVPGTVSVGVRGLAGLLEQNLLAEEPQPDDARLCLIRLRRRMLCIDTEGLSAFAAAHFHLALCLLEQAVQHLEIADMEQAKALASSRGPG